MARGAPPLPRRRGRTGAGSRRGGPRRRGAGVRGAAARRSPPPRSAARRSSRPGSRRRRSASPGRRATRCVRRSVAGAPARLQRGSPARRGRGRGRPTAATSDGARQLDRVLAPARARAWPEATVAGTARPASPGERRGGPARSTPACRGSKRVSRTNCAATVPAQSVLEGGPSPAFHGGDARPRHLVALASSR